MPRQIVMQPGAAIMGDRSSSSFTILVVDENFYRRMRFQWRDEQDRCQRDIDRHMHASDSYMEEGVALLGFAQKAQNLFELQTSVEKRTVVNLLLSNCVWQHGKLTAEFRQPFDLLVETNSRALAASREHDPIFVQNEIWLRGPDSNRRPIG